MKIYHLLLTFAIAGLSSLVSAQSFESNYYFEFDWDKELPTAENINTQDTSEVTLKHRVYYEYYFDPKFGRNLVEIVMIHRQTVLRSNSAIEQNNKLYIPLSNSIETVETKARVINPDGSVIEKSKDDLIEAEEDGDKYQYFAMDGIQRGAIVEYMYIMKQAPSYNGRQFTIDTDHTKYDVEYRIISPENLVFVSKSYNLPELESDTTYKDYNSLVLKLDSVEAFEAEPYSNEERHRAKFTYKIDEVVSQKTRNLVSYAEVAKIVYSNCYEPEHKKESKAIAKFIDKNIDRNKSSDQAEMIRYVEDVVRENITPLGNSSHDIRKILKAKYADDLGMVRVFVEIFKQLDIDFRVVVTSNRFNVPFDKDFESYVGLGDYLIYFPEIDQYMSPGSLTARLGFIEIGNFNNYGIFIEEIDLGGTKSSVMEIDTIVPPSAEKSINLIDMDVRFNDDLTANHFEIELRQEGYYAMSLQPLFHFFSDDRDKENLEEMLLNLVPDSEFEDVEGENLELSDFGRKPFIVRGKTTSPDMINRAGNKILLKVGELIGRQSELYSEEERKYPIENAFNQNYKREIRVEIPEGYEVTNLDDLVFNEVYGYGDREELIGFVSSYKIEGNTVVIEIQEYYRQLMFPADYFENFQKVINAAADFNKVVLIFQKKA